MPFKIELGAKVRDKLSDYKGVVYQRVEYLYGNPRYGVQTRELKDGKPVELTYFDEDQLDLDS